MGKEKPKAFKDSSKFFFSFCTSVLMGLKHNVQWLLQDFCLNCDFCKYRHFIALMLFLFVSFPGLLYLGSKEMARMI